MSGVTYPDKLLRPVAERFLSCLCTEALANPSPPQRCGFRPYINGTPLFGTLDDECCGGLAFLYVGPMRPAVAGTTPDTLPVNCKLTYMVEMQIGIWRCAPPGDLQLPPDQVNDWDPLQLKLFDDRATLRGAVCCFISGSKPKTVQVGDYSTMNQGPEGMCIGEQVTLTVNLGRARTS
jgi:hypothetical protein